MQSDRLRICENVWLGHKDVSHSWNGTIYGPRIASEIKVWRKSRHLGNRSNDILLDLLEVTICGKGYPTSTTSYKNLENEKGLSIRTLCHDQQRCEKLHTNLPENRSKWATLSWEFTFPSLDAKNAAQRKFLIDNHPRAIHWYIPQPIHVQKMLTPPQQCHFNTGRA